MKRILTEMLNNKDIVINKKSLDYFFRIIKFAIESVLDL